MFSEKEKDGIYTDYWNDLSVPVRDAIKEFLDDKADYGLGERVYA